MVKIHFLQRPLKTAGQLTMWLLLFCAVSGAAASAGSDYYQQGIIFFNSGNYEKAYDLFLEAFKATPDDLSLNFYLGRAAFEIGNYEMALMAFERILIARPEAIRIKLEMARTYYRLGLQEDARRYFKEVLASNPPLAVRRNIEIFLADIELTEKRHFCTGLVSLGVDWDDNVYAAPVNEEVETILGDVLLDGDGAKPKQDWIFNTTGILNYTYKLPDNPFAWTSTGSVYQALYRQESDLDTLFLVLNTGPEVRWGESLLGLHGVVNYLEIDWDRYLLSAGAELVYSALRGPNMLFNIIPKFENKKFYQTGEKDSNNVSLTVASTFSLGAYRINLAGAGEIESAQDDIYSYRQLGGRVSLERKLPFDAAVFGYYEYRYKAYEGEESLFGKKRKDNQHYVGVGLSKTLWHSADYRKNLVLGFNYRYTNADSNIGLYEYDRNVASGSLAYTF